MLKKIKFSRPNKWSFIAPSKSFMHFSTTASNRHGIAVSITQVIEELNGIREVTLVRKEKKSKHLEPQVVLSKINAIQQKMCDALNLKQYCEN